jgi:hypothetical protein
MFLATSKHFYYEYSSVNRKKQQLMKAVTSTQNRESSVQATCRKVACYIFHSPQTKCILSLSTPEVKLHSLLTLALGEEEWFNFAPLSFYLRETMFCLHVLERRKPCWPCWDLSPGPSSQVVITTALLWVYLNDKCFYITLRRTLESYGRGAWCVINTNIKILSPPKVKSWIYMLLDYKLGCGI